MYIQFRMQAVLNQIPLRGKQINKKIAPTYQPGYM